MRNGIREKQSLPYAPTPAKLQAFAQAIYALTTCGISLQAWTQTDDLTLSESSGEIADPGIMLRAKLQRTDDPTQYKMYELPAPKLENFDHIQETGYRLKQAAGEILATAYSALTAQPWQFREGWLIGGPGRG